MSWLVVEGFEPDSIEAILVDRLFEAFSRADGKEASVVLRHMSLRPDFELRADQLIPFFREVPEHRKLFARRIVLRKRSRGRPKKPIKVTEAEHFDFGAASGFFESIAIGDEQALQQELSKFASLRGNQLLLLANLFDPNSDLPNAFSWRLDIRARKVGKPQDAVTISARDFQLARALRAAVQKYSGMRQKEAAIQHVMTATGMGRSAVIAAMDRLNIRSLDWKSQN